MLSLKISSISVPIPDILPSLWFLLYFSIVFGILNEIEESIGRSSLVEDLRMSELPALHAKCAELVELLVKHHLPSFKLT